MTDTWAVTRTWYVEAVDTNDAIESTKNWLHSEVAVTRLDEVSVRILQDMGIIIKSRKEEGC